MRKTVLVYRHSLLPPSETFIKSQVSLIKEWDAILFGLEKSANSLDLSGLKHHICQPPQKLSLFAKLKRKVSSILNRDLVEPYVLEQASALNPSLIHAHFAVDALEAYKLAKALKIKLVVTLHGYDVSVYPEVWASGQMGEGMRDYPARLSQMANDPDVSFIAVSNALKNIATAQFDIPADKVKVIYLGINPDDFPPSPIPITQRPLKVLFVGRMVEKKAPDVLIKAFAEVQKQIPDAQLVMIGDGPMLQDMQQLASTLKISVDFKGVQPSSVVKSELETSRIFCLPSIRAKNGDSEGLPIVLLEAQSMGVPVVTSASGAENEGVYTNVSGVVFKENDQNTLKSLLTKLLSDETTLTHISSAGPDFIKTNHDSTKLSNELISFYSFHS